MPHLIPARIRKERKKVLSPKPWNDLAGQGGGEFIQSRPTAKERLSHRLIEILEEARCVRQQRIESECSLSLFLELAEFLFRPAWQGKFFLGFADGNADPDKKRQNGR